MIYNKYGNCAIKAYELVTTGIEPREAWQKTANELFGNDSSQAKKSCPKTAFLALLEANKKVTKNVEYVLKGLSIIDKIDVNELESIKPLKF